MSAQSTPTLPHMWIDPSQPGMIRFGDPDDMAGMLAGIIAANVVRACNNHRALVAALKAMLAGFEMESDAYPEQIEAAKLAVDALAKAGEA